MLYGLYQSSLGAELQSRRMEVLSNNMANSETSSFKRDLSIIQTLPAQREPHHQLEVPENLRDHAGPVTIAQTFTDHRVGSVKQTGGSLDVAITGPGFFRVDNDGEFLLSRAGELEIGLDQKLIQADTGLPLVQQDNKPIIVPADSLGIEISNDGFVYSQQPGGDKALLGQLDVVEPRDYNQLEKVGDSLYRSSGENQQVKQKLSIKQGFIEQSNVEPLSELTDLMQSSRLFEANLNLIKSQDQSLSQLLQSVGS